MVGLSGACHTNPQGRKFPVSIMNFFRRALPHLLVVAIVLSVQFSGGLTLIQNHIVDWRFEMTSRPVSGDIVIVGIDPKSLEEIGVWPWPRRLHARLLERLQAAGAAEIAFDIDFSMASTPRDDAIFEAALAGANGAVILPVFRQTWSVDDAATMKATRPLERFAQYSWLTSVGIPAGQGGQTRVFPYGDTIGQEFYPSIPAFFGNSTTPAGQSFYIDFSIRPQTLKRFSYIDVLEGRVGASELAGKKIIIGASAVELRDNFSVPVYGVISGPMLQALSTESVIQNRTLSQTSFTASTAGLAVIILFATLVLSRLRWRRRQLVLVLLFVGIEGAALGTQWLAPVIIDTSMWLVAIVAYIVITMLREVNCRRVMEAIAHTRHKNTQATLDRVIADNFDGILIADQDGLIETASRVAAKILDQDPNKQLVGMKLDNVLPAGLANLAQMAIGAKQPEKIGGLASITKEVEFVRTDGNKVILDCVVTPSQLAGTTSLQESSGQGAKIITITFRDVTKLRQAERDMRDAAKIAISANQAKTDFLATMSHELRTPLNAIIGFADLMKQEIYGPLGHNEYGTFANQIHTSGAGLLEVLNAIMQMGQVESGTLEINEDELDVLEIVEALINRTEAALGDDNRHFVCNVPETLPLLFADQRLVERIVSGILNNAAKFTQTGGTIQIDAAINPAGEMAITITDDGVGIAPEHLGKVTQSFYQAQSSHNRSHEGCGLGLTLSDAFAQAHQGRVEITSQVERGTQILVVFPAQRVVARALKMLPGDKSMHEEFADEARLAAAG